MTRDGAETERGLALMAAAMLLAPFLDLFAKLLTATMSPGVIGLGRFALQSVILLPFLLASSRRGGPEPLHALAGAFLAAALVFINAALAHMPVANVIAIFFVEPLILTLLSALILGEQVGWRRLSAVVVGLVGALIVIRPNWQAFGPAAVYPLFTAFFFAGYLLVTRVMTRRGGPTALQFWTGLFAALALLLACLGGTALGIPAFELSAPGVREWAYLGAMGLVAAVSHQLIANAFARAEASVLAPLQYLEIISATLIGWFVFADFPDRLTWLGTAIIIGAGLYVFRRERQLGRRGPVALPPDVGGPAG